MCAGRRVFSSDVHHHTGYPVNLKGGNSMKKFLSVVLALVMTLSLVIVGASASNSFKDNTSIKYKEAVDVLTYVDVINGYSDGTFNPAGSITRGAAAKIICNLVLGPTVAAALPATAAPFKDVPVTNTFAGYITYCAQQGIINGYSDGTFRPAASVTGFQFMKMLLGALGYDGSIEGFTGSNWTLNVSKLAVGLGLNKGNDNFNGSAAATREEACLYAYNTLQATLVEYASKGSQITINGVTIAQGASKASDVTSKTLDSRFNIKGNEYGNDTGEASVEFAEKYFPKLVLDDVTDDFGRPSDYWTFKNSEIGTYPQAADFVYTSDMTSTANKAVITKALKNYTLTKMNVYMNGKKTTNQTLTAANIAGLTGNGVDVELYADGDAITDVIVIHSYVGQVSKVNSTDETITVKPVGTNASSTGFAASLTTDKGYGTYVKDDYVMVSPAYDNTSAKWSVGALAATKKVSGTTTYSTSSKVTVGGTSYDVAYDKAFASLALSKDVDLYLDAYGYAAYSSESSAKDYVYIVRPYTKADDYGTTNYYVQGVLTDGTTVNYKINTVDGVAPGGNGYSAPSAKTLYSYTISGSKITLTSVADATSSTASYVDYAVGTITSSTKALNSKYFTGTTTFIAVTGTGSDLKVSTYTGKQLVSTSSNYALVTAKSLTQSATGDLSVVFVDSTAITNENDLILLKNSARVGQTTLGTDKNTYDTYDAYINGEAQEIAIDSSSDALTTGALYTYGKNNDGAYVLSAKTTGYVSVNKNVISAYGDYVTVLDPSNAQITVDISTAKFVDLTDNGITDNATLISALDSGAVKATVVYNSDSAATYVYIVAATMPVAVTANTSFKVYAKDDSVTSITYVCNGTSYTVAAGAMTADTATYAGYAGYYTVTNSAVTSANLTSVKVSTTDGFTFTMA
jgi:hypothetical protein